MRARNGVSVVEQIASLGGLGGLAAIVGAVAGAIGTQRRAHAKARESLSSTVNTAVQGLIGDLRQDCADARQDAREAKAEVANCRTEHERCRADLAEVRQQQVEDRALIDRLMAGQNVAVYEPKPVRRRPKRAD